MLPSNDSPDTLVEEFTSRSEQRPILRLKNGRTGALSGNDVALERTLRLETLAAKALPGSLSIRSSAV